VASFPLISESEDGWPVPPSQKANGSSPRRSRSWIIEEQCASAVSLHLQVLSHFSPNFGVVVSILDQKSRKRSGKQNQHAQANINPVPPMETATRGRHASPRSPTLSEISMILPDADKLRSLSPAQHFERPPSPPSFYTHSNRSARTITLGSFAEGPRKPSLNVSSPPLSTQSSRSTLRNMGDSETAPKVPLAYDEALASSPTLDDSFLRPHTDDWQATQQRRLSNASSSTMNSDDLEDIRKRWPGFDSHPGFDDSGVDLEDDEEEKDQFPVDVNGEADNEPWLKGRSGTDENAYSSDLYSRRAEIILANAKKRLNVCLSIVKPCIATTDSR
jgi:hypothetical protein